MREDIESYVKELAKGNPKLSDRVIFTGNQTPVHPYYQAFDTLLFPSIYEGMPGTVIEAQALKT